MENEPLNSPPTPPSSEPTQSFTSPPSAQESSGWTPPPIQKPSLTTEQKVWILVSHLSVFVGFALIAPLVVYLIKKDEDVAIRDQAQEALNFHITMAIVFVIGFITAPILIGFFIIFLAMIYGAVCAIIAAIQGVDGKVFRYPLTWRPVK